MMDTNKAVNILLVDDDPAQLLALEAVLETLGQGCVRAGSGREALKHVLRTDFAVILLDVRMPDISGFDTARLIREHPRTSHVPIIFVSASDDDAFPVEKAYALGAIDYLTKPLIPAVLRAKVAFFVDLYRKTRELARIERERHTAALMASEERYRTLFESMDEGFCVVDVLYDRHGKPDDYRFLEINPAFEKHTGFVNALGKTIRELVPDHDAHWFETYGRVAQTGEAVRFEQEAKAMGRWFDVYALRLGEAGSNKVAVLFKDMTARKRDEDALRQLASDLSAANRRKTEFLAILAHELRNPLAPIRSGLELMRLAGDNAETVARVREMMDRQLGHLIHLVDDLLDIARIAGNKLDLKIQRVDLKSLVQSAVETSQPLIEGGGHAFSVALPDEDVFLDADPIRISQVIGNLLNNAAKYTPPGGLITLSALRMDDDAVISVSDTGIGIPEHALGAVFEMFTQVERSTDAVHGGLGIGLSLVRRLVEQHGGTVSAASPGLGKGSTFTVRLPLAARGAAAGMSSRTNAGKGVDAQQRSLRVLVADDNMDAAEALAALLEQCGHSVCLASDGCKALQLAREFRPDIAFLDIGMPGMNGYEVAQAFRQLPESDAVVLVALTGWGAEEDRARSKAAGFNLHLTKPVAMAEIEHLLASMTSSLCGTLLSSSPTY